MGGTWDLFRYPGIRSDSDMFTLGYSFRPWKEAKAIADGAVDPQLHPRDRPRARRRAEHPLPPPRRPRRVVERRRALDGRGRAHRHRRDRAPHLRLPVHVQRLLPLRRGLHARVRGHRALRGRDRPPAALARGPRLHRQARGRDRQRRDGSHARPGDGRARRARDDAPALADLRRLTALGRTRSPTRCGACCPRRSPIPIVRWKNVLLTTLFFQLSRRAPRFMKRLIRKGVQRRLPAGYDVDTHFKPRYNPWDQRVCLVPDGDLFAAIRNGSASVVTDASRRSPRRASGSSRAPSSRPT